MPELHMVINAEEQPFQAIDDAGITDVMQGVIDGRVIELGPEAKIEIGVMPQGMKSGKPSAMFVFTLPDGRVVFAETSLLLLWTAAVAFRAAYEEELRD